MYALGAGALLLFFFHRIITTNTHFTVFTILTAKGRGNFSKIEGGREQKSLGSPALNYGFVHSSMVLNISYDMKLIFSSFLFGVVKIIVPLENGDTRGGIITSKIAGLVLLAN